MTKVVLIRHGRSSANAAGLLAGRAEGVALDDLGQSQALELRELFSDLEIAASYSSPIQRCVETANLAGFPAPVIHADLTECDYGTWTMTRLDLHVCEQLWAQIQARPSEVAFPEGESMLEMSRRSVSALREIVAKHGPNDTVVVFSHGDPIKAILADALGMAFDDFQRINVNPAGVSVIEYGARPLVLCLNAGADVVALLGSRQAPVVGGGDVAGSA